MRSVAACALLAMSGTVAAAPAASSPDLAALIECRARVADFTAALSDPNDPAQTAARGWHALPPINPFMSEYALDTELTVFGYTTSRIAFSGSGVVAVLDLPDPRPLAHRLELQAALDTPKKVLYGREVLSEDVSVAGQEPTMIESIILSVSNVDSHPGKTLAGCSYSLDLP